MANGTVHIDMADAMRNLTLKVTVTRSLRYRARMRVGIWILRLAGRVMGFGRTSVRAESDGADA